ncbi:hypothetical protein GQ457_01G025560 [Hibiscus cannabinus]
MFLHDRAVNGEYWGFRWGLRSQSKPKIQSDVDLTPDWDTVFFAAVVYRSWTFGFDSGIPRVTISGRFCDWTGSRGLHMLVSEPGYVIIGTVSEVSWL